MKTVVLMGVSYFYAYELLMILQQLVVLLMIPKIKQ
jgi:hypothetical protein